VLAGLNIETSTLFQGTRGAQIAGRYSVIPSQPFGRRNRRHREEWQSVVGTLEQSLRLHRHRPGTLLALDAYLHDRTSGLIGSLSQLIREAAIEAIDNGSERITKRLLDSIELDHTVEEARSQKNTRKPTRRRKAA
jgi:hypothetical protein